MKIDNNVLPPIGNYSKIAIEIVNTLKPGESTLLDKINGEKIRTALNNYLYKNKLIGKKFVTRFDRQFGSLRVWRVQ